MKLKFNQDFLLVLGYVIAAFGLGIIYTKSDVGTAALAAGTLYGATTLVRKKPVKKLKKPTDVQVALGLLVLGFFLLPKKGEKPTTITKAPGAVFRALALRVMSKKFFDKHFGQTIADAREEIAAALASGDNQEAHMTERELKLSLTRIVVVGILTLPAAAVAKVIKMVLGFK